MEHGLVGCGFDLAELGVGKAFGEVADVGGEGGFVAVGRMGAGGLAALENSGLFTKMKRLGGAAWRWYGSGCSRGSGSA